MAISKQKKEEQVSDLKEMLPKSEVVIIADYRGLTATQMADLRNRLRPLHTPFLVIKNTLITRSLQDLGRQPPAELLEGPTAIGLVPADSLAESTRIILQFTTEADALKIKGGLIGDKPIGVAEVTSLSTLPSSDVIKGQALAGVQSPISGFLGVIDSAVRGILYAMNARVEQLEGQSA